MAQIKIDDEKAARLIAHRLREEARLSPADANALAVKIVEALIAAAEPTKPGLSRPKIIPPEPASGD
jgi:hypothetical protein